MNTYPTAYFAGLMGIGTSTPYTSLTLDRATMASSSITVTEYAYGAPGTIPTSTAATIDARTANQIYWPLGGSATTLTICNMIPGQHLVVRVHNPNQVAGALTWASCAGTQLYWANKTTPSQTTTANSSDIYSFMASSNIGSTTPSTVIISGVLTPNF